MDEPMCWDWVSLAWIVWMGLAAFLALWPTPRKPGGSGGVA
jgi:hypothetical protein